MVASHRWENWNMPAYHLISVYGNGWQAVFPVYGNGCANHVLQLVQPCLTACATMSYSLCNCVLRFMEMVGKQFSPFMEMVVQLCLTACVTASYGYGNGWQAVLPFMETVLEVVRAKISGYIKS